MRPPQTILVGREIPQALDLGAIRPVTGIQQVLRAQEAVLGSVGLEIVAHLEEMLHDLEGAWRGDAERVVDAEAEDEDADGLAFAAGALADRGPRKASVRIRQQGGVLGLDDVVEVGVLLEAEAHQCGINYLPREEEDGWGYGEGGANGKNEEDGLEKGAQEKPGPNGKLVTQEVVAEC